MAGLDAEIVGCVYLVTNKVNGKQYVGQTKKTVQQRWKRHVWAARKGSKLALHNAIRKYGAEDFSVECLEAVYGSHADLMAAEIRHIAQQGCRSPKGYNLMRGGDSIDLRNRKLIEGSGTVYTQNGIKRRKGLRHWLQRPSRKRSVFFYRPIFNAGIQMTQARSPK